MVVSILGILSALAVQGIGSNTCRARQTEAMQSLRAALALEAREKAESDAYVRIAAACTSVEAPPVAAAAAGKGKGTPNVNANANATNKGAPVAPAASSAPRCLTLEMRGRSNYVVSADVTSAGFTATAVGRAGTAVSGSVWRIDQSGTLVDVSGSCRVKS